MNELSAKSVTGSFSEMEKMQMEHKLRIREILLEKILFGILIVIISVFANFLLEKHKADLTKEVFTLKEK